MTVEPTPAAEVPIDTDLVRGLLADQHPDLAELPLVETTSGWDNAIYRLGDRWCVRLPRRALAAPLVEHEQRWLPVLEPALPLRVPAPRRVGGPGRGYPWTWSICDWIDGVIAAELPPLDRSRAAVDLGSFVAALHRPAPNDAPPNPVRGGPLADRSATVLERIDALEGLIDTRRVTRCWEQLAAVAPWLGPPLWLHGDLHLANLLVADRQLVAVIDFGDITAGDPATDLAVAWMLFDPPAREEFRAIAGHDDEDTWARGRGWALAMGLAYLAFSSDSPAMAGIGHRTIAAVLADG